MAVHMNVLIERFVVATLIIPVWSQGPMCANKCRIARIMLTISILIHLNTCIIPLCKHVVAKVTLVPWAVMLTG